PRTDGSPNRSATGRLWWQSPDDAAREEQIFRKVRPPSPALLKRRPDPWPAESTGQERLAGRLRDRGGGSAAVGKLGGREPRNRADQAPYCDCRNGSQVTADHQS